MPTKSHDLNGHNVQFVPVRDAVEARYPGAFNALPFTARVLAENIVRRCTRDSLDAALAQVVERRSDADFPFYPARVVLQDLLGTPALVDLAGLRDAVADAGGNPDSVNPDVPTLLVVDHSLNVDVDGMVSDAMSQNMTIEQSKNAERFEFLTWAKHALKNLDIVMPGNGILHQINLERMSPVVHVQNVQGNRVAFIDTLVGTDSHTTMIDALGVLGWGVGGIEAESVMLGRPIWMRMPEVVAVELTGRRQPGVQATDVVLALTEYLRAHNVVGTILEFRGQGAEDLPLPDRATIANMAPEFGATAAMFAIDERTLEFLRLTGRLPSQVALVEAYAKAQGLWVDDLRHAQFSRTLYFDLSTVDRSIAGPAHPHQRITLHQLVSRGIAHTKGYRDEPMASGLHYKQLPEGAVVIAAITSCTNTSNPRNLIAAGLVARKAVALGLGRKPWVKTSFAPGSKVVESYLQSASLLEPLEQLGFGIVGFGCTSCNGMSGPLSQAIEQEIVARNLHTTAVLSGNRNFNGRVHPRVKESFLASPALVVAYAIAGSIRIDIENEALGQDATGSNVFLRDLWPSDEDIDNILAEHVRSEQFSAVYDSIFSTDAETAPVPARFPWRENSTYIRRPPYWGKKMSLPMVGKDMCAIAILGDDITTDDLSPSGAILPESASGQYLMQQGVHPADFNSYGTRRGDHVVAVRATFANHRLSNEMTPGVEGSFTRLEPQGQIMPMFDAACAYLARGQELLVVAGKNYGCGSSRDWAAKGVRLLGVRAVIAESFERIHRTNLVGMGVLPLEFEAGITRHTLGLDGTETYTLETLNQAPKPSSTLQLLVARRDGSRQYVTLKVRIDTDEERQVFKAGGLLQRIGAELMHTI